jgi:uncharacterized protein
MAGITTAKKRKTIASKNLISKFCFIISKPYICLYFIFRMDKKTEDFYNRLREELQNTSEWPNEYLFKFIVPTEPKKIEVVENAFDNLGAVITTNQSKTGKYTSISINVMMENPDNIIQKYIDVSTIEGIISL